MFENAPILLFRSMEKVKVAVGICGGKEHTFKPPAARDKVKEFLKELYGVGELSDADGDVVLADEMEAGSYVYTVLSDDGSSLLLSKINSTSLMLGRVLEVCKRLEKGVFVSLWSTFYGEIASSTTTENTIQFRRSLVEFYGDDEDKSNVADANKLLRCMVTNLRLPGTWITAAHLFPRKETAKAHMLGIIDVDDPRNGMLWNRAIEEAFTLSKLIFREESGNFVIHILDDKLKHQKLSEIKLRKPFNRNLDYFLKEEVKHAFENMKFGDLNGKALEVNNSNRPFKRALSMHAMLALHKAKLEGTLPTDLELYKLNFEYWSEGSDKQLLNTFLGDSLAWLEGRTASDDAVNISPETFSSRSSDNF